MEETAGAGLLWIGAWSLLLLFVMARNVDAYRRKCSEELGEQVSVGQVMKMRRWRLTKLPLIGVFLAGVAEGETPLRRFLAQPQPVEGGEIAILSAICLVLLVLVWRAN